MLKSEVLTLTPGEGATPVSTDVLLVWQTAMALNFADFTNILRAGRMLAREGKRPLVLYLQLSEFDKEINLQRKQAVTEAVRLLPGVTEIVFNNIFDPLWVKQIKQESGARIGVLKGTRDFLSLDLQAVLDFEADLPPFSEADPVEQVRELGAIKVHSLPGMPALEMDRWTLYTKNVGCLYQKPMPTQKFGLQVPKEHNRGCSFCDSNDLYVKASDEDNVELLAAQLEAAAPLGFGEYYFQDLSPTHLVKPLVLELEKRGVKNVNLFMSTRIDVLQANLPKILSVEPVMKRLGHRLHFYLVGFETFVEDTLKLYNKGISKRANIEGVHLLRRLGRKHRTTIEPAKYRSHGFILFQPWSTLDTLIEEIDEVSAMRFQAFRSGISQTKLKLISSTALGYLVEKDGLLAETFKRESWKRVAQQGIYGDEHPWNFKHLEAEVFYQLSNALATEHVPIHRQFTDEVVLMKLRHLASALRTLAPERWRPEVEADVVSYLDKLRSSTGLKKKGRPRLYTNADVRHFSSIYLDLPAHPEATLSVLDRDLIGDPPPLRDAIFALWGLQAVDARVGSRDLVFVGKDRAALTDTATKMQAAVKAVDGRGLDAILATTSMPVCCRRQLIRTLNGPTSKAVEKALAASGEVSPWLANLPGFPYVPYVPCKYTCGRAILQARAFRKLTDRVLGKDHARVAFEETLVNAKLLKRTGHFELSDLLKARRERF